MIQSHYNLGSCLLKVKFQTHSLQQIFDKCFAAFLRSTPIDRDPDHRLQIYFSDVLSLPNDDLKYAAQGPLFQEGQCRLFISDQESYNVLSDFAALYTDHAQHCSSFEVVHGHETAICGGLGIIALTDAVFSNNQFVIHSALLGRPKDGKYLLIFAPSGTGKTTTALQLLKQGFSLASDDLSFLKIESTVKAYGLPRNLKVHRNTAAMLPWVEPLLEAKPWSDEDEKPLTLKNLARYSVMHRPEVREVAAIIKLNRGIGASQIKTIGQTEVYAALVADNVRAGAGMMRPFDRHQFTQLTQLVSMLPAYELHAGNDLENLSTLLSSIDC